MSNPPSALKTSAAVASMCVPFPRPARVRPFTIDHVPEAFFRCFTNSPLSQSDCRIAVSLPSRAVGSTEAVRCVRPFTSVEFANASDASAGFWRQVSPFLHIRVHCQPSRSAFLVVMFSAKVSGIFTLSTRFNGASCLFHKMVRLLIEFGPSYRVSAKHTTYYKSVRLASATAKLRFFSKNWLNGALQTKAYLAYAAN
jgi:hypothetical protein